MNTPLDLEESIRAFRRYLDDSLMAKAQAFFSAVGDPETQAPCLSEYHVIVDTSVLRVTALVAVVPKSLAGHFIPPLTLISQFPYKILEETFRLPLEEITDDPRNPDGHPSS